jgi:2-polyprenyl-3-methyl-5-hydroxy-6-metoxy-1,4-benzoquinol methylase
MATTSLPKGSIPSAQPTTTTSALTESEAQRRDALAGRLLQSCVETVEFISVYLGHRLGLYRTLADIGPATPGELATRAATDERTTREWLEQQAVAGNLDVDDPSVDANARRYSLSPAHREVFVDRDSLSYSVVTLSQFCASIAQKLPALLDAFRTGRGVPYADYGQEAREAQEFQNRPPFINLLGREWLPAISDIHARLQADPPARVADIGCGAGWSSIAIARAYPKVHVDGFDLDRPSIARATANTVEAGLSDRVTLYIGDASDPTLAGRYDLVTAFECVHDMGRPVEALRAMRSLATVQGAVIVMDERVAESFTVPGDQLDRLMHGCSVLYCLPIGLADSPSVGTGTVMRPATLRRYALEAGFQKVEILPVEYGFWRFYRLVP